MAYSPFASGPVFEDGMTAAKERAEWNDAHPPIPTVTTVYPAEQAAHARVWVYYREHGRLPPT